MIQANKQTIKVDLHTHSIISHDGGITAQEYEKLFTKGILDCLAITDHNEIRFARIMQQKLGDKIIIGEEITTIEGEVIGLFLNEVIPGGLSFAEAIARIKQQKGIVYIPHPFETSRKGLQKATLVKFYNKLDIIETFNGRGILRGKAKLAQQFAETYSLPKAASSDAHSSRGIGYTYSVINEIPTKQTLLPLLTQGTTNNHYAPFYTLLYPTINRVKNRIVLTNHQ